MRARSVWAGWGCLLVASFSLTYARPEPSYLAFDEAASSAQKAASSARLGTC